MPPHLRTLVLLVALAACESGRPPLHDGPAAGAQAGAPQTSELQAGPARPVAYVENPYARSPRALREGERLYGWMNCAGCHGPRGGGGIGPPFADGDWIYGGDAGSVFQSIVQGRPNGMPAFGGRLPSAEVWKIVAFVQTLGDGAEASSRPAGVPVEGAGAADEEEPGRSGEVP